MQWISSQSQFMNYAESSSVIGILCLSDPIWTKDDYIDSVAT